MLQADSWIKPKGHETINWIKKTDYGVPVHENKLRI